MMKEFKVSDLVTGSHNKNRGTQDKEDWSGYLGVLNGFSRVLKLKVVM